MLPPQSRDMQVKEESLWRCGDEDEWLFFFSCKLRKNLLPIQDKMLVQCQQRSVSALAKENNYRQQMDDSVKLTYLCNIFTLFFKNYLDELCSYPRCFQQYIKENIRDRIIGYSSEGSQIIRLCSF